MDATWPIDSRADLIYPESDGKPMAETPLHRDEMHDLIFRLRRHLRHDPGAYVSGNMMVYYEQGNPAAVFSPDVFVALGAGDRRRRIYKLWEEACGPTVVFEVSSRGTSLEDEGNKKVLCARLGVREYWLYDPEAEYLDPPLQGWQLSALGYVSIRPQADGFLPSRVLGVQLALREGLVELYDASSGDRLLRADELGQRLEAAEREIERLIDEGNRTHGSGDAVGA
jgi:Uma2 family endonuclease